MRWRANPVMRWRANPLLVFGVSCVRCLKNCCHDNESRAALLSVRSLPTVSTEDAYNYRITHFLLPPPSPLPPAPQPPIPPHLLPPPPPHQLKVGLDLRLFSSPGGIGCDVAKGTNLKKQGIRCPGGHSFLLTRLRFRVNVV